MESTIPSHFYHLQPNGLLVRDTKAVAEYRAACTLQTCPLKSSYYAYLPSLGTNAAFLTLFSVSLLGFILQAALSWRFVGFTIAMVSGCILEVLGYVGRIMSHHNPFDQVRKPLSPELAGQFCGMQHLTSSPTERLSSTDCLLNDRASLPRCWYLFDPFTHCP